MNDTPTSSPVRLRPSIAAAPPYRQGAAPQKPGYKLSSNENPFEPLPSVLRAISEASDINRYAAAAMPELRESLAREFGVSADHVHLAAGSVAILYQLVHAAAGPGEAYLHAWPSFEAYPALGLASGAAGVRVPLNERAEHDLDAMAAALTPATRVIVLCTPNNPTGPTIARSAFDTFMARVPDDALVVLDEAYREFITDAEAVRGEDVLHLHPNLVVLRTFSKAHGLAGLRVGYAVGHPAIISAAQTTAIPLSVTGVADAAARASLAPAARRENAERIERLVGRRDELARQLRERGVNVPETQGNFVWIPEAPTAAGFHIDARELGAAFAEAGTLVRPFPGFGVRISVGEAESAPEVLRVIGEFITE